MELNQLGLAELSCTPLQAKQNQKGLLNYIYEPLGPVKLCSKSERLKMKGILNCSVFIT